jgi:hypothetical protein
LPRTTGPSSETREVTWAVDEYTIGNNEKKKNRLIIVKQNNK